MSNTASHINYAMYKPLILANPREYPSGYNWWQ